MDCLPIPHNWSVNLTSNIQGYIYEPLKLKFDIHPSYIYIVKQMNTFKDYFNSLGNDIKVFYYKDKQMTFYDFF
jgi:WD40 repeat protein